MKPGNPEAGIWAARPLRYLLRTVPNPAVELLLDRKMRERYLDGLSLRVAFFVGQRVPSNRLGRIRKPSQNGRSVPLPRFCEIGEWRKRSKPLLFRGSCGCHSHLDRFADTP